MEEKAADDAESVKNGIRVPRPGMNLFLLSGETAAYFGMALDEFEAKPAVRRAEMMAHLVIKRQRENYEADLARRDQELVKKMEKEKRKPAAVSRWMLSK